MYDSIVRASEWFDRKAGDAVIYLLFMAFVLGGGAGFADRGSPLRPNLITQVYGIADTYQDGVLCRTELLNLAQRLGHDTSHKSTNEDLERAIESTDPATLQAFVDAH